METYKFRIVFINYFKNLCNLRNLWIKSLFGCGSAALGYIPAELFFCSSRAYDSSDFNFNKQSRKNKLLCAYSGPSREILGQKFSTGIVFINWNRAI